MNNKLKSELSFFALLFVFAAFIGTTLIGIGYTLGSRAFEQRNEKMYMEIGYNMGRMQVLDSLTQCNHEKNKTFDSSVKPFRSVNAL